MNEQETNDQDFNEHWSGHPHRHHAGRRFRARFGPPGFDQGGDVPGMPPAPGGPGDPGRPGRPERAEFGGRGGFGAEFPVSRAARLASGRGHAATAGAVAGQSAAMYAPRRWRCSPRSR